MKSLLEFLLIHLVTNPDSVSVEEQQDGTTTVYLLHVDPIDIGRIIGKMAKLLMPSVLSPEYEQSKNSATSLFALPNLMKSWFLPKSPRKLKSLLQNNLQSPYFVILSILVIQKVEGSLSFFPLLYFLH